MLDLSDKVEQAVAAEVLMRAEKLRRNRQEQFFRTLQVTIHNAIVGAFKPNG